MDWRTLANLTADLLVGGDCPGCGLPGLGICPECRLLSAGEPFPVQRPLPGFPRTVSQGSYAGPLRQILVSAKERQGLGCLPVLSDLLATSVAALLAESSVTASLVPVPSAPARVRERGYD
ncbi:MAG: ComF family protein, partial [Micropruina sp.]